MRVRRRVGVEDYLAKYPDLLLTEAPKNRDWTQIFGNDQPLEIEVGSGKGDFILGMAKKYPQINFVAIDLQETVLSYALDKLLACPLPNVRLLLANGSDLTNYFEEKSIAQLYLNFSDPWPKKRHAKRRLTADSFLAIFEKMICADGKLCFKTDNRGLFEWSLSNMSQYGMIFDQVWLDLHSDLEFAAENVMTEYERKFSSLGQPIYRLVAHFKEKDEK